MSTAGRTHAQDVLAVARNAVVDNVTGGVTKALDAVGVRAILLKGPAMARWLYHDGTVRTYADIDLLVPEESLATAERVLAELGFEYRLLGAAPGEQIAHGHEWVTPDDLTSVDLHHRLYGMDGPPGEIWQALSGNTERMIVGGASVETLSSRALALLVVLHAACHGSAAPQPMEDLRRALDETKPTAWQGVAELAARVGALPAFVAGLRLDPRGLEIISALGLPQVVTPSAALHASSPPHAAPGIQKLLETDGFGAKVKLLGREFFPTPEFMRVWSPLARRGRLGMALARAWRPLWLLGHSVPALLAVRRARRDAGRPRA